LATEYCIVATEFCTVATEVCTVTTEYCTDATEFCTVARNIFGFSMLELASCDTFGAQRFEMAYRFL
jgi:hypothetical protein